MPVSVVIGGQYGSEGKGKVAKFLARGRNDISNIAVRVGGSNSGHTVIGVDEKKYVFRHLPSPCIYDDVICMIGAGSYIDPDVLLSEIEKINLSHERLKIDPNAVIIKHEHKYRESQNCLNTRIGSTLSGTGAAVSDRINRVDDVLLAKDHPQLSKFTLDGSVSKQLCYYLNLNERVIIEGTQGFGLSVIHSSEYPKTTSRDTTASSFISEAGISPFDVDEIVLTLRAFPIRVAGNSGKLSSEISWDEIAIKGGWNEKSLIEYTSVTGNIRRVANFDPEIVISSIEVNKPNLIVLNHADLFDYKSWKNGILTDKVINNVRKIEKKIKRSIDFVGIGPDILIENKTKEIS